MSSSSAVSDDELLQAIPPQQRSDLRRQLDDFLVTQSDTMRPVCLVSSGGTAVDLDGVRTLENFSTGLRGAAAVEEFLERGYAVLHLWRTGSAAPFGRVVQQQLGLTVANHPLTVESLDRLFAGGGHDDDDIVQTVLQEEDDRRRNDYNHSDDDPLRLHRSLSHSVAVQRALQQRREAAGRLLTIPFRSVDEYLAKLQLCSHALHDSATGALAMFFLAAAVSDFYWPQRSAHKIQSDHEGLSLHLQPVPKVLARLRRTWAPQAFVVSFKLETDATILRQKSERAVERYGCHMVIGNLLQSRHDQVSILAPTECNEAHPTSAAAWPTQVVQREGGDSLEAALVDVCVQSHLEFVSYHHHHANDDDPAAWQQQQARRVRRKAQLRRQAFWGKLRDTAIDVSGVALALVLSYTINTVLQRRFRALQ